MLVSYKWLKELVDIDVPSQELAEKMSTTGIEVEGVESPAAGLSKLSSEKFCLVKMYQKLTSMSAKSMWVKKKPVKSSVERQMCVQASRSWWLFRVPVSRITTRLKRENPWLRVTRNDLFTW